MENFDPEMAARVWQRVRGQQPGQRPVLTPARREQLRRCHRRLTENLRFFETQTRDPVWGEAFTHLARQTREHRAMIEQMLGR